MLLDYTELVKLDPTLTTAVEATQRLPLAIKEKEEKEKEEMMSTSCPTVSSSY